MAEAEPLTTETLTSWFSSAKEGDNLKKLLVPKTSKTIFFCPSPMNLDDFSI